MDIIIWIMIIIAAVLLTLLVLFLITSKKERKVDYYSLYIMGMIWVPLGLILDNMVFFIVGLVFMSVGLAHRSEWKKNHVPWGKLTKKEKKIKIVIISLLGFLVLAGFVLFLLLL